MKNRDIIHLIKMMITESIGNKENRNESIDKDFFTDPSMESKALNWVGAMPNSSISNEDFKYLYGIAIKEKKAEYHRIRMNPSESLDNEDTRKRNWLTPSRIKEIGWESDDKPTYRSRYFKYLKDECGRSENYVEETERSSLDIVRRLGDPKSDDGFYVRGLVVGSVQSGKTANFNAVINSAIDTGYSLIIVLSGIMEDLRQQTQRRIEADVEGKFEKGDFIGVGRIVSFGQNGDEPDVKAISVPTSIYTDFNKSIKKSDFSLAHQNLLVCKKNTSVLKNLLLWLRNYLHDEQDKISSPLSLLIIDDEADNASLNNLGSKGRNYASTINGHIRALLGLFYKRSYLGYTATPFANVLQDRHEKPSTSWLIKEGQEEIELSMVDSLFPNDFIELLFPESNYIGAKHFFETRFSEIKQIDPLLAAPIEDHLECFPYRLNRDSNQPTSERGRHTRAAGKYDDFPNYLPNSLKESVMCFILATAIRISRMSSMRESKLYHRHNTMLVHVSRFILWQNKTRDLIQEFVEELIPRLENESTTGVDSVYEEFERCWYKNYAYVMENIKSYLPSDYKDDFLIPKTFKEIKPLLIEVANSIEVKAVNSSKNIEGRRDELSYPKKGKEKTYIAIGGNRLSRGFTLEGLTVNYFIRNTSMSDTLMQMGRWFGYRPGYIDCCKLFTTNDCFEKFNLVTRTTEDLEQKFIEMNRNPANTPETFGLRVLTHPDVIKLTRASILKNTEQVNCSYSDCLEQTTKFKIEKERIESAWASLKNYLSERSSKFEFKYNSSKDKLDYLVYNTESVSDVFSLLDLPNSFNNAGSADEEGYFNNLKAFISLCNEQEKLTDWSIVLRTSGAGGVLDLSELGLPCSITKTVRAGPVAQRWQDYFINEHVFPSGAGSSNIHGGGVDLQIRLDQATIEEATSDYKNQWIEDYRDKNPSKTEDELLRAKKRLKVPEKAYRRRMTAKEGVIVIYLLDLVNIFQNNKGDIKGLTDLRESLNLETPLIGYAIGIPEVGDDVGGTFLQSIFHKSQGNEVDDDEDDAYNDYQDVLESN